MTQLLLDADCLLEISPNEWPTLQNLYASKKTESIGYNLIKNYIEWIDKKLNLDVKCFTLDEDWRKDGTFIMIAKHGGILDYVYFNTLCDDLDRLIRLLHAFTTQTKASLNLYGYGQRLKPAVDDCIKKLGPKKFHESVETAWYKASKELVATFSTETPPGITLRKLEIEDAETVNELWPHHDKGTIKFVKHVIKNDLTIAACDSNGKLLAWCLRLPLGSLGLLQVLSSQKRLGLGSLMVRVLSKKIAEQNLDVFAPVVTENTPSRRMFEKLGFEKIDDIYWTLEEY
ncbi:uncharacterized protein LOC133847559 [Drosophila sulfurigaster albostrigata]|uniref:uncharacterized protein LOC133847559 n=1 Tax=Drosophila sulfurigaster albostrigata TaxID=89887 RepID=UPI002D21E770|nr:uncharacterized protein LOC133847559 [Drosophila sulfurigaster albostrigata]